MSFHCTGITSDDLVTITAWTDEEGWNVGFPYLQTLYNYNPDTFIAAKSEDGELIGVCYCIEIDDDEAMAGLFIVKKERRHQGVGKVIWGKMLERLGKRNVRINAAFDKQEMYQNPSMGGFKTVFALQDYELGVQSITPIGPIKRVELTSVDEVSFEKLVKFDTAIHTIPRENFLKHWLKFKDSKVVITERVTASGSEVCGYGILTHTSSHRRVCPLYATTETIAHYILYTLCKDLPKSSKVLMNGPRPNSKFIDLMAKFGATPVYKMADMVTKNDTPLPLDKVYAFAALEATLV